MTTRIQLLLHLNYIWKRVARSLADPCKKCGKPRLFQLFDAFITGDSPQCVSCSAYYSVFLPLIRHIFSKSRLTHHDISEMMKDSLTRKSMLNVVRGISHFGIRLPQPTAVPVVIVWNYTNRCNLKCIHCHQDSGENGGEELTKSEAFTVIDRLAEAGVSILTFSGGEPLVRPDIFEAARRASDSGMLCTIASNGTLMSKETARRLKKAGITRVEIGLDGCRAETHDFLRNTPGSFAATVKGIKNCVEEGFSEICATMTLHSRNVKELPETVKLAEDLGVTRFYVNRLIPAGRGRNVVNLDISREEKMSALDCIYQKFYHSAITGEGIQCFARGMTYYGRLGYERSGGTVFTVSEALSGYSTMWLERFNTDISELIRRFAPGFGGCSAGITYAGLTAGGDLLPCVPAPIILGNLLEEDLEDIWVHNEVLNYMRRRDELKGTCGRCGYKTICGGCRYTAYALKNDWLEGDPSCPFGPAEAHLSIADVGERHR